MQRFHCPKCHAQLKAAPETDLSAKSITCPKCQHRFRIGGSRPAAARETKDRPRPSSRSSQSPRRAATARPRRQPARSKPSSPPYLFVGLASAIGILVVVLIVVLATGGPDGPSADPPELAVVDPIPAPKPPAPPSPPPDPPAPPQPRGPMSPKEVYAYAAPKIALVLALDPNRRAFGQGSGFFISKEGLLVTNFHVIAKAHTAAVVLPDKSVLHARRIHVADKSRDIAVLAVDGSGFDYLEMNQGDLPDVGSTVFAIGSPKGLTSTLSQGMVTAHRDYYKGGFKVIQTDTEFTSGSSGGPLLGEDGKVVGLTTYGAKERQTFNFAIPTREVARLLEGQEGPAELPSSEGAQLDFQSSVKFSEFWTALRSAQFTAARAKLAELQPQQENNPYYYLAWGKLQHGEKKYAQALESYQTSLKLQPNYTEAQLGLAAVHLAQAAPKRAAQVYQQAIEARPGLARLHLLLGDAHQRAGGKQEAARAYQSAAWLDAKGSVGEEAKRKLEVIQGPALP